MHTRSLAYHERSIRRGTTSAFVSVQRTAHRDHAIRSVSKNDPASAIHLCTTEHCRTFHSGRLGRNPIDSVWSVKRVSPKRWAVPQRSAADTTSSMELVADSLRLRRRPQGSRRTVAWPGAVATSVHDTSNQVTISTSDF